MTEEIFPIVDENGNITGKATRKECHSGSKILHPVVHLHVLDQDGNIFLQLRSRSKEIQPGKWDTSVGGHVDFGENVLMALKRESKEELGIELNNYHHLLSYVFESDIEKELIYVFSTTIDRDTFSPTLSESEIDDARFFSDDEIQSQKGSGIFTPNFISEYERICNLLRKEK